MHIVVLTDPFGKPLYVPRVRYLCDYLVRQGHDVHVFSENIEPIDFQHSYDLNTWRFINSKSDWVIKSLWSLLTDYKSRWFTRKVMRAVEGPVDCVIVSTSYTFPLLTGLILAKKYNAKLVADLRDIAEQAPDLSLISHRALWLKPFARLYNYVNIKRRNRVLKKADALITVSPWHQRFLQQYNTNVHLIYNGYDSNEFFPIEQNTDIFRITYTGRLYSESLRNPKLLFEALSMISDSMPELCVDWYIDKESCKKIDNLATEYNLSNIIHTHNYIPRSEVNAVLNKSSIVLVLSNKSGDNGPHGVMTTKFYEALGAKRPILVVRSDEECLEQVVNETHAGCAARNIDDVINFIRQCYAEWKNNGGILMQNNISEKFNREVQSADFLKIIEQL